MNKDQLIARFRKIAEDRASRRLFIDLVTDIAASGDPDRYTFDAERDFGADPTGEKDSWPAHIAAMAALASLKDDNLRQASGRTFGLKYGPGRFKMNITSQTFDFLAKTSFVTIQGEPGASIWEVSGGAGVGVAYANMSYMIFRGLAFRSLNESTLDSDVGGLFDINAQYGALFEDCMLLGLIGETYLLFSQSRTWMRRVRISNCASKGGAGFGLVTCWGSSLVMEDCSIDDSASYLNGYNDVVQKTPANKTQIAIKGNCRLVSLRDSFIDEGCLRAIDADGDTGRVGRIEIIGGGINPPVLGGGQTAIRAIKTDEVLLNEVRQDTGSTGVAWLDLQDCKDAVVQRCDLKTAATAINADSACGRIRVIDTPAITAAKVVSAVPVQFEIGGTVADMVQASGGVTANRLVKPVAGGAASYAEITMVTDPEDVAGPALESVADGIRLPVARPGQIVTVLSDGNDAIAPGDPLTVSSRSPARVMIETAPKKRILGRAISAAAAAADAAVRALFTGGSTPYDLGPVVGTPKAFFRADIGVDVGPIYTWADILGNKNAVQAVLANQPKEPVPDANLNNQLAISFASAAAILATAAFAVAVTSPFTVMIVGYKPVAAGNKYFFDSIDNVHRAFYASDLASGGTMSEDGTGFTAGPNITIGSVIICVFNGAASKLYVNAHTPVGTGTCGTHDLTGLTIGNIQSGAQAGTIIAEVRLWQGALAIGDVDTMNTYAGNRYGISIGA